jgi:hypothetical protein
MFGHTQPWSAAEDEACLQALLQSEQQIEVLGAEAVLVGSC